MQAASKKQHAYRRGHMAETIASFYLICKGYRILARRMRNGCGEIDIIASNKNYLIAVEVKARQDITTCLDSITPTQRQRITRAMSLWSTSYKNTGLAPGSTPNIRFDVILIAPYKWPKHIKDAWR